MAATAVTAGESLQANLVPRVAGTSSVGAAAASDTSGADFKCITARGLRVTISSSDVARVSYLRALFDGSGHSGSAPCVRDANELYVLPVELEQPYLGVVLAYSAQRWKDQPYLPKLLMTNLSVRSDFAKVLALLHFLGIAAPALPSATANSSQLDELLRTLEDVNRDSDDPDGNNIWARNAAVTLCVALAAGQLDLQDSQVRAQLFKCFKFILKTPRTFRRRLRWHAYAQLRAHCSQDMFSGEQWKQLEQWEERWRTSFSSQRNSDSDTESEDERNRKWANAFQGYYSDSD